MTTPLDALADALCASAAFQQAAEAAPEAVLWCDPIRDFFAILPALRARLPQVLTLGDYDPSSRTGPALWLRAVAARQVATVAWAASEPPIIYVPGHGRDVLRGAEDCPAELGPLVWFAISGAFFGQPKQSRDWTLRGFLAAQGSPVGMSMSEDKATREALGRAASRLFTESIPALVGRQWDAMALDGLLVDDPVADMLAWIDGTLTPEVDPARFDAFSTLSAKQFSIDPRKKSRQDAAARLARREKTWGKVWDRFEEANGGYDGVAKLLGFEEPPQTDLLNLPTAYPKENARRENDLRSALKAIHETPADKAILAIRDLDKVHGWRRKTVWAKRGEARLAQALACLVVVAEAAHLPTHDAGAMAAAYAADGWKADSAALDALDLARNGEDRAAVVTALRTIYLPWLDAGASALQALVAVGKVTFAHPTKAASPPAGAVLLFVDGLRMDLAHRLLIMLRRSGASVSVDYRWSGFPTVTATCKALASPAAGLLNAGSADTMYPTYEGREAVKPVLMKAIEATGWSCGDSLLGEVPVWLEGRSIDRTGEDNGVDMVSLLRDVLTDITETVIRLARQGRRVRIVTDHGFLLMPNGLPHAALTAGLAEPSGRAKRVALLKEGASSGYLRVPWTWDTAIQFATPPGIRAFYNGIEYAHGGISPQECILPVLDVTAEGATKAITLTTSWRGLMVKVKAVGCEGLMADVRVGADTSGPSALIKGPKELDDAGEANLGVDSDYEGQTVCIVIYHLKSGPQDVLAKQVTKTGG
jgi:hypothetical protein